LHTKHSTIWRAKFKYHSDHDIDNGWTFFINSFAVRILDIDGVEPFGNDKGVHPAEETPEDDETAKDLTEKFHVLFIVDAVESLNKDTETHVSNTHDN